MSKKKLTQQIERFSVLTSLVSFCPNYNNDSIKPFIEGAQIYKENYRSNNEFINLIRLHDNLMRGSVSICNSLFENYEPLKQKLIYEYSRNFFNLLNGAKKIIDEVYKLAYTVGRNDETTTTIIENEKNPLIEIHRKVILSDGDYEIYKKTMFNWKCSIQSIFIEEQYMKHIVELCNSRKSKFNPLEVKINKCSFRKVLSIPDKNFESTPTICRLNSELKQKKTDFEIKEKNDKLTTSDINNYIKSYREYQRELISFVFLNFSKLYNETCVQCIKVFLEQQHSIVFNMLEKLKQLEAKTIEEENKERNLDEVSWNVIDKVNSNSNKNCKNLNSCKNKPKVVGSLT